MTMNDRTSQDATAGCHDDSLPPVWDERLQTGVPIIDLQHHVLFNLIVGYRQISPVRPSHSLTDLLDQVRSYAAYHFAYEERWLSEHCQKLDLGRTHAHLHVAFVDQLAKMDDQLLRGELTFEAIHSFLKAWLIGHIIAQDLPLIRALQNRAKLCSQSVSGTSFG